MHVDWDKLETFYHVANAGSFALASKQLGKAQPSLSRTIKVLETQLGVELFYRSVRGLVLTAHGERLLKIATRMFENAQEALKYVQHEDKRERRDYKPHLKELKNIWKLDYEAELKLRGIEAARVLINSAHVDTMLELERVRDEILEMGND